MAGDDDVCMASRTATRTPRTFPTYDTPDGLSPEWHRCPAEGCVVFPFETAGELLEHIATDDHPTWDTVAEACGNVLAAGVSIDAPERSGAQGSARTPAAPAVITWAKHDSHGWVLRVPAGAGSTGDTVDVHKKSGEVAQVVLGDKVGTRGGDALHTPGVAAGATSSTPASPKQLDFARRLIAERTTGDATTAAEATLARNDRTEVSALIDSLLAAPKPTTRPAPQGLELEVGRVYATAGGEFVKVRESKAGRLYGKVWDGSGWEYDAGSVRRITRNLTAEEAARWGHEHGSCVFCSRSLEDDKAGRSVEVGYGPICAAKYGLPWG